MYTARDRGALAGRPAKDRIRRMLDDYPEPEHRTRQVDNGHERGEFVPLYLTNMLVLPTAVAHPTDLTREEAAQRCYEEELCSRLPHIALLARALGADDAHTNDWMAFADEYIRSRAVGKDVVDTRGYELYHEGELTHPFPWQRQEENVEVMPPVETPLNVSGLNDYSEPRLDRPVLSVAVRVVTTYRTPGPGVTAEMQRAYQVVALDGHYVRRMDVGFFPDLDASGNELKPTVTSEAQRTIAEGTATNAIGPCLAQLLQPDVVIVSNRPETLLQALRLTLPASRIRDVGLCPAVRWFAAAWQERVGTESNSEYTLAGRHPINCIRLVSDVSGLALDSSSLLMEAAANLAVYERCQPRIEAYYAAYAYYNDLLMVGSQKPGTSRPQTYDEFLASNAVPPADQQDPHGAPTPSTTVSTVAPVAGAGVELHEYQREEGEDPDRPSPDSPQPEVERDAPLIMPGTMLAAGPDSRLSHLCWDPNNAIHGRIQAAKPVPKEAFDLFERARRGLLQVDLDTEEKWDERCLVVQRIATAERAKGSRTHPAITATARGLRHHKGTTTTTTLTTTAQDQQETETTEPRPHLRQGTRQRRRTRDEKKEATRRARNYEALENATRDAAPGPSSRTLRPRPAAKPPVAAETRSPRRRETRTATPSGEPEAVDNSAPVSTEPSGEAEQQDDPELEMEVETVRVLSAAASRSRTASLRGSDSDTVSDLSSDSTSSEEDHRPGLRISTDPEDPPETVITTPQGEIVVRPPSPSKSVRSAHGTTGESQRRVRHPTAAPTSPMYSVSMPVSVTIGGPPTEQFGTAIARQYASIPRALPTTRSTRPSPDSTARCIEDLKRAKKKPANQ